MKTLIVCWNCLKKLRIPAHGEGKIKCPYCDCGLYVNEGKIKKLTPNANMEEVNRRKKQALYKYLAAILAIIIVVFIIKSFPSGSFSDINFSFSINSKKPHVEFKNNALHIYNVYYTVGMTGINEVNTNIREVNKDVWSNLKDKNGQFPIYRHTIEKDKYGNSSEVVFPFGQIDLGELNKYKTYKDFEKAGGILAIIIKE
ncbi:hypothetical protein [Solitalea koreensis]|uniref:hypothetical protein n=1 Tax=Solitalea koreensis TaxID=543615 RepID=UPI00115B5ECB|nr:hypothetical protein [Solitalea koreensis]